MEEDPEFDLTSLVPTTTVTVFDTGDTAEEDAEPEPPERLFDPLPPEDICTEGEIRCRANNTNAIEICKRNTGQGARVTRWVAERCAGDQVCVDGVCGPFECVPGRITCNGLDLSGVCNDTGDGLLEVEECPEGTACRGGICTDPCEAAANSRSYLGCEYMAVELPNYLHRVNVLDPDSAVDDDNTWPYGIVLANPDTLAPAIVTVYDDDAIVSKLRPPDEDLDDPLADPRTSRTSNPWIGEVVFEDTHARDVVIPPSGTATLVFERRTFRNGRSRLLKRGRRIVSNRPIAAYQFNPYCCSDAFTNDASLLFPIAALGTEYTAIAPPDWPVDTGGTYPSWLPSGLGIVATQDDTQVQIKLSPSADVTFPNPNRISLSENNRLITIQMDAHDAVYLESESTEQNNVSLLGGSKITSNHPVAVFANHLCTNIPTSIPACDHLESQLMPDASWGQRFVLGPMALRSKNPDEVVYWQIQAPADRDVKLTFTGDVDDLQTRRAFQAYQRSCAGLLTGANVNSIVLPAGGACVMGSRDAFEVRADAPVLVAGYLTGEDTAKPTEGLLESGDPAMFIMPPVEQFRTSYNVLAPRTYNYNFITLILTRNASSALTLDGAPLDLTNAQVTGATVLGSEYMLAHLPIGDGPHTIASTNAFGVIVYAYDRYVSYAYPGGLNLTRKGGP